jgi:hypothetical protein
MFGIGQISTDFDYCQVGAWCGSFWRNTGWVNFNQIIFYETIESSVGLFPAGLFSFLRRSQFFDDRDKI